MLGIVLLDPNPERARYTFLETKLLVFVIEKSTCKSGCFCALAGLLLKSLIFFRLSPKVYMY